MKKKNLATWFGMFFAVMLLLTVLSRASDSVNVARVTVEALQNQVIIHQVRGNGKVLGTKETAVFAPAGQRVERILVQEGREVKEGELLLVLSGDTIQKRLSEKKTEIQKKQWELQELSEKAAYSREERANRLKRAQEDYDRAVNNGKINVANASMEANVARQKLQIYYDSVAYDPSRRDTSTEQALRDEIRSRDETVNQVLMNRDQEVAAAERALEDAKMEAAADNSIPLAEKELEILENELGELEELKKSGGEILAPVDGVVKNASVSTGQSTGEEAAIVLYETSGNLRMTGSITQDDLKYVGIGDTAELKGGSGKKVDSAVVEAIREDENDPQKREISVVVPEGTLSVGESVEFTITRKSGPYRTCIPLSGLYEENGTSYVFVTDVRNSVLGEVLTARRVEVTVEDKNEQTAALGEGAVSSDQKIIVSSSRLIENGSRVRLQES